MTLTYIIMEHAKIGGKGIGKMIATAFAVNGCQVYICGRNQHDLNATADEVNALVQKKSSASPSSSSVAEEVKGKISSKGGKVIPLPCDLQSLNACRALVDELGRRETRLDVLVNNSGATWGDAIDEYPDAAWEKLLTLNLQRVFTLTQMLLPLLRRGSSFQVNNPTAPLSSADGGSAVKVEENRRDTGPYDPARIINIGSIAALCVPTMENYAYSASKAGLHHLSHHLAVRLGAEGITSNVLACGPFETKMMRATLENFRDTIEGVVPLGRIGTPQDVGGAALFLAGRAG